MEILISKFWFNEVSNRGVMKHTKEVFSSFLKTDSDNKVSTSNRTCALDCIQNYS